MKHNQREQYPIKEKLIEEFIQVVGEEPTDLNKSFLEMGMNSIKAVDFVEAINNSLELELGVEVVFDFRGISELTDHIEKLYFDEGEKENLTEDYINEDSSTDIAIIGISGRFAGSENVEELWSHLKTGESCIREVQRSGWDEKMYYMNQPGQRNKSVSKWGGMLSHIDQFDAEFFGISPEEAEKMDPQQRITLEESFKAFEDADYPIEKLAEKKIGVFIGARSSDYRTRLRKDLNNYTFWGNEMSMLASRISYFFNFKGPSLTVDTACSSSLVAIHLASDSIRKGESEIALAGGVFITSTPEFFLMSSQAGLLSPTGQCKAFDSQADGMVLGEGAGMAVLKSLDAAVRDQDHIYGVIKGTAVNQAGRTNGLSAPSVSSQKQLIKEIYSNTRIHPETIGYIEAHGTGTLLGDQMELKAISEVFKEFTNKTQYCAIGSHKPNIGHSTLASGMAGLFKILMALKYRVLPPLLTNEQDQENLLENSPFIFNTTLSQWESQSEVPLRAALNALGSNGTNAHLIIEEWENHQVQAIPAIQKPYYLFLISAKNKVALRQRLVDLVNWLENNEENYTVEELACTLAEARSHYTVRCSFIASSLTDLYEQLFKIIDEGFEKDEWYQQTVTNQLDSEHVKSGQELIHTLSNQVLHKDKYYKCISELSELYMQGNTLEWAGLYQKNRKVPLPSYPFCKTSYWIPEEDSLNEEKTIKSTGLQMQGMEKLVLKLLFMQLQSLGILNEQKMTFDEMEKKLGLSPVYSKWFERSLQFLIDKRWVVCDEFKRYHANISINETEDGWEQWERQKQHWLASSETRAQTILVENTLQNLPNILIGKKLATDVMFPNSSMELVEGIYQNNVVADYFNNILAQKVVNDIQKKLSHNPETRIRIIEIGAGTGGTSFNVLKQLDPYSDQIAEYRYTDISKAFLVYAEKKFAAYPFVTYSVYNAEDEALEQDIPTDIYDIVIATNVLHATQDIAQTLRQIKKLLKRDGLLILNEITDNSLFLHLTFGLLEGWWLFKDDELRLPGGPAVSSETWEKLLEQEGFKQVNFPAEKDHEKGQQIIMGVSDGQTRQKIVQRKLSNQPEKQIEKTSTINEYHILEGLKDWMGKNLSNALSTKIQDIHFEAAFRDYGVDSISGINLVQTIKETFSLDLGTTILFEYTTINQLANFLMTHHNESIIPFFRDKTLLSTNGSATNYKIDTTAERNNRDEPLSESNLNSPIAIVGMSGKFADSDNVNDLWRNISEGANLISYTNRWRNSKEKNESIKGWEIGSFVEDIDQFDPFFFNISGLEANYMDPQQRLFLMAAWQALEDAGYAGKSIEDRSCGVYVGCNTSNYHRLINNYSKNEIPQAFWGNLSSIIPARIAYYLNLKGPGIAIDTACSSSLVAIHLACQGLWTGEVEMALAGGVSIQCTPELYQSEYQAGMLSSTGQCYTFDDRADGFVPGEGIGVVLLKRLDDALSSGDHIYGVIRGSGINQDGTTNGITAPSLRSQMQLERSVYDQFGINPEEIQLIEAHGTGTKLGDPIEFQALTQAFQQYTDKKSYCAIGSIKTNIGHTQAAAGVAGLIKVLLSLKNRKLPPSLHFEQGNNNIEFENSPFFVNTKLKDWQVKPGVKRLAALSSFGVSGTNAHMVIEEGTEVFRTHEGKPSYLLVLSARSEKVLQKQAQQLIDFSKENDADIGDICFTLIVGRKHFKHRLACIVSNKQDIVDQLSHWLEYKDSPAIFTHVVSDREYKEQAGLKRFGNHCIQQCNENKEEYLENLSTVADLYVQGYDLDYAALFTDGQYGRIPLPTYPFERDRYWVPQPDTDSVRSASPEVAVTQRQGTNEKEPIAGESQLMTFTENWQRQDLAGERVTPPKAWVCFLSDPANQQVVRHSLQTRYPGTEVIFIAQDSTNGQKNLHHHQLNRTDGAAYRQTLDRIVSDWGTGFNLLYLWPLEARELLKDYLPLFHLFQAVQEAKPARCLWAGEWTTPLERSYLESWVAWERSLGLMQPQMGVAGILQQAAPEGLGMSSWVEKLTDELTSTAFESVLYERETRYVSRIKPAELAEGETTVKEGGTYLITGGGGGLGRQLASSLVRSRTVNLVLTGRSPLSKTLAEEMKKWELSGSQVIYCQADVCDPQAMESVLQEAKVHFGGIDGVIHAAGLASTEPFFTKSAGDFERVLAPKVEGVQVLDDVLVSEPLDFVCYFSSSSAILGDMGSGDYAMANRFLMTYAAQRQKGYPGKALVINWPLWKEGGMGMGDDEQTHMYLASSGQRALETEEGLALLERLLGQASTQYLVLAGQPDRVTRFLGLDQPDSSEPSTELPTVTDLPKGQGRREEMKGLSIQQCVEWDLKETASNLLQIPRNQLHLESNLADFGFDSITLATFAERLTAHYQIEVTPALFFGYPTLGKLTAYYMTEQAEAMAAFYREGPAREKPPVQSVPEETFQPAVPKEEAPKSNPDSPVPPAPIPSETEPIAVIGMSGRFPGARNIDEMWEHLVKGEEQVQPTARWKEEGKQWRMGEVPGVSEFDPAFFEISPREAETMDPRQRLLLQESWKALEDAGYGTKQIESQRIGMFVGVENGDYQYLTGFNGPITGNHDAILAARLSYVLNLNGPNMAINTACSSGLTGLHQACQSLRMEDCETAIAAGVNLILMPQTLEAIDQAGMLSPDGRCYAFGEHANGMVPGEAVTAVVLKRLSQAEAANDPIYAVIRGSGMNYDGKTNGITAPNGMVQAELYRSVYDRYGIDPESLSYIVTHGTGTRLGDPVEVNGLQEAFKSYTKEEGFCAITSTKPNFGHTFAASGLVSLISLVQAMRHETIPASLHCEQENSYIQWKNSPFYVNRSNQEWKDSPNNPRRGAVSAFGMSGTNVHLVVESYPEASKTENEISLPYYLLALSAKTEQALEEKITDLINYLESPEGQKADPLQLSYTLLNGRQHFRHRWAMVAYQKEDALYTLKQAIKKENAPNLFQGKVPSIFTGQTAIKKYIESLLEQSYSLHNDAQQYQENLMALASMYCQGYEVEWTVLFSGTNSRYLHIPTYPFEKNTYWVKEKEQETSISNQEKSPLTKEKNLELVRELDDTKDFEKNVLQQLTISDSDAWQTSTPRAKPESVQLTTLDQDNSKLEKQDNNRSTEYIETNLAGILKEVLALDQDTVDRETPFVEMGMDSIIGIEWIQMINEKYQTSFTANSIYEYPNIRKFAMALAQELPELEENRNDEKYDDQIDSIPSVETQTKPREIQISNTIEEVQSFLIASLAESLSIDQENIALDSELIELGLDSIIGVEWIQVINKQYGVELTANVIYEYPYLRNFAEFLYGQLDIQANTRNSDSSSPDLQKIIEGVLADEIDIERADQLLQNGGFRK